MEALAEGVQALGGRAWFGGQSVAAASDGDGFDLVACWGMSSPNNKAIVARRHAQGKPVLVYDHPLLRWVGAGSVWYMGDRVGLYREHVGRAWPGPASSARLSALGVQPGPGGDPDGPVLLLGQVPLDASHDLGLMDYMAWVQAEAKRIIGLYPEGTPFEWRPHPGSSLTPAPLWFAPADPNEPLREALPRYRAAYTHTSAAQYECYAAGVPCCVASRGDTAPVAGDAAWARLAAASWNDWAMAELRDGSALQIMLDGPPVEAPAPVPAKRKRVRHGAGT